MAEWIDVGATDDIADGGMLACDVGGIPVVLFRLGDEFFALHDRCSHGRARLSDGFIEDDCVECPLHQGLIDIRTGAPRSPPVTAAVRSFAVQVRGSRLEIQA